MPVNDHTLSDIIGQMESAGRWPGAVLNALLRPVSVCAAVPS